MTLEAWVKPTVVASWNTVVFKERTGYYGWAMYANTGTNRPSANNFTSTDNDIRGTAQVAAGAWTYLTATYDGAVLALYVNGVQAATMIVSGSMISSTGALKIGGNAIWGEFFNGLIDEVRIYNRALPVGEIQTDMNKAITSPDATPPSAPGTLTGSGTLTTAQLNWTRGDRQRRRRALRRLPRHDRGLHADRRQPDRPAGRALLHRHRRGGRVLLQGRRRGRRGQHRARLERSRGHRRRHRRSGRARDADGRRWRRQGDARLGRGDRQRRRHALRRLSRHEQRLHALASRTASASRPGRASSTSSPRGRTSTRSPPRTPPAISGRRRTRRAAS